MWLACTQKGLFWVHFGLVDTLAVQGFFEDRERVVFKEGGALVEHAAEELERYFKGRLGRFSVRLDLTGTPSFSRRVWRATRKIPFGQVRTYAWVAEKAGGPNSARAVGRILGSNPIPMFIPCHRVVGARGWLGGFSAGLSIKKWLLALESGQRVLELDSRGKENE
jgi:methylated-DNA-[protein]-cysteine S-methyltransferase